MQFSSMKIGIIKVFNYIINSNTALQIKILVPFLDSFFNSNYEKNF